MFAPSLFLISTGLLSKSFATWQACVSKQGKCCSSSSVRREREERKKNRGRGNSPKEEKSKSCSQNGRRRRSVGHRHGLVVRAASSLLFFLQGYSSPAVDQRLRAVLDLFLIFHRVEQATMSSHAHDENQSDFAPRAEHRCQTWRQCRVTHGQATPAKSTEHFEDQSEHRDARIVRCRARSFEDTDEKDEDEQPRASGRQQTEETGSEVSTERDHEQFHA